MCGIVGAVSTAGVDPAAVARARDAISHRGPDHRGLWSSADGSVCLGHSRLAIVDLSADANQPFVSHDGRYVVSFNGEIYNYRELRRQLEAHGAQFRTGSDTEVLLQAFAVWGERCLTRLSGMFAFAVWDELERRLFCARDRVGEKPFHYAVVNGTFLFASELKALLAWDAFPRVIDYHAVVDFLSFGFVTEHSTIWKAARKLPAGCAMSVTVDRDDVRVHDPRAWWDLEFDPDHRVRDWGPEIRGTLEAAAGEMALADVPVGAFLSGGVDSSSVVAALTRGSAQVRTFTIGFDEPGYDERPWATAVAEQCHTLHHERVLTADDVDEVFTRLLWFFDEPFGDYASMPMYYLCRDARRDITVALSGDGADELFGGYTKYQRLALRQRLSHPALRPGVEIAARGARLLPGADGLRRSIGHHTGDVGAALLDTLQTGMPIAALRRYSLGPLAEAAAEYGPADAVAPYLRRAPPAEVGVINAMRYLDVKLTLGSDMLVKVDRASMAVSLETRPVYLHADVLALAARVPPERLANRHGAKVVLKSALEPWLPRSVLHRRKQGFALPLAPWMRGELGKMFTSARPDGVVGALIQREYVETLTREHREGTANHAAILHNLALLDRWLLSWNTP